MGWLRKLLGGAEEESEALAFDAGIADLDDPDHHEVNVVGEASYQDALARLAGHKSVEGKQHRVGVTLRCEPGNQYDANAVRVEAMGQLVGYLPRTTAAQLCPGITAAGGAVEAQGLIVGGWDRGDDTGHYGIRVWLAKRDADRIGLQRPSPVPDLPLAGPGEVRLSPSAQSTTEIAAVTVTCEEHYQPAISASKPSDWNRDWWPCLATLAVVDANPHSKNAAPCIEVRLGGSPVGYFTPAMTERYSALVRGATDPGNTASAQAQVNPGTKSGATILRLKVVLPRV